MLPFLRMAEYSDRNLVQIQGLQTDYLPKFKIKLCHQKCGKRGGVTQCLGASKIKYHKSYGPLSYRVNFLSQEMGAI